MPIEKLNIVTITTDRLHSFLSLLKKNGFTIGIQTYKDCTDLIGLADKTQDAFKNYLSAIICKNDEQTDLFSSLFDSYFKDDVDLPQPPQPPKQRWYIFSAILLSGLAILIWLIYFYDPHGKVVYTPQKVLSQPYFNSLGATGEFYLDSVVENQNQIKDLKVSAQLNNEPVKGWVVTFSKLGKNELSISLQSKSKEIDTVFRFKKLYIAHKSHLQITSDKENEVLHVGEEVTYSSPIDATVPFRHYWIVDNDTVEGKTVGDLSEITLKFDKKGQHPITIEYQTIKDPELEEFPKSYYSATYTQEVVSDYIINVASKPNQEKDYAVSRKGAIVLGVLFLLILLLGLLLLLIFILKQKSVSLTNEIDTGYKGDQKPYDLPFRDKEYLIKSKADLVKLARELKKQVQGDQFNLDISQTIKRTIKNNGLLSFVTSNKKKQNQYLLLINEEFTNSQQLKLFKFLASRLLKDQVIIDFYFYHQTPTHFYTENSAITYSIAQLQDLHYNAELIVMSKGYEFLNLNETFKNEFTYWDKRILITPISQIDWSQNELYLKNFFSLVPADIEGLLHVVQLLSDQVELTQISRLRNQYPNKFVDCYDMNSLRNYLKNQEDVFQWICALACFPRLEWNLILSIGDALLKDKNNLNYEMLLRVARIEWMHQGSMSSSLRFTLLKELSRDNELKTRALLVDLLEEYPIDKTMFAFEEKRTHQINNNFILYASGYRTDEKTKNDHDLFLSYYSNNHIHDFSLLKYLEKDETDVKNHGAQWETPIRLGNTDSADLKTYKKVILKKNANVGRLWLYASVAVLCFSLIPLIVLHWMDNNKKEAFHSQLNADYNLMIGILPNPTLSFEPNDCSRQLFKSSNTNKLTFNYGKDTPYITIPLDNRSEIELDPSKEFIYIRAELGSDYIQYEFPVNSKENYQVTLGGCAPIAGDTTPTDHQALYIQYFPERIKDSIALFQTQLGSKKIKYNEGLEYRAATNKSEVRYFASKDKALAEQLAKDASAFFNQEIAVNPKLENSKESPIEIWIKKPLRINFKNTSAKSLTPTLNKANKYEIDTTRDLNNGDINTLYYSNKCSISEVKELASLMIGKDIPLKVVQQIKNLAYDFQIGNINYSNSDYMNLTVNDISRNVFKRNFCYSNVIDKDNYTVYFDYDKTNLREVDTKVLNYIANQYQDNIQRIEIKSYAKFSGAAYDLRLSERYSKSIAGYLNEKGVDPKIIESKGMGNSEYKNQKCFNRSEIKIVLKVINPPDPEPNQNQPNNNTIEIPATKKLGYLYYGQFDGKQWTGRNFDNSRGKILMPKEGDKVKSTGDVTIREGEMKKVDGIFVQQKGIGVLKKGTTVTIKQVIQIAGDSYIWIAYEMP